MWSKLARRALVTKFENEVGSCCIVCLLQCQPHREWYVPCQSNVGLAIAGQRIDCVSRSGQANVRLLESDGDRDTHVHRALPTEAAEPVQELRLRGRRRQTEGQPLHSGPCRDWIKVKCPEWKEANVTRWKMFEGNGTSARRTKRSLKA